MPRIYAACLASYNAGRLYGRWIDLDTHNTADEVRDEIAAMLRGSPCPNVCVECPDCGELREAMDTRYEASRALGGILERAPAPYCDTCDSTGSVPSAEEWAIHDYDDLPSSFGEHPNLGGLIAYVEALDDLDGDELEAFKVWFDQLSAHDFDMDDFREAYAGTFNSWADFAEHLIDETGMLADVPENVARYFDYESYGRDLRLGGDAWEEDGHYFWNH